jgi:hypothetical protein
MAKPTPCEARLAKIIASFEGRQAELLEEHTDCSEELSLLGTGLYTFKQLIHISPPVNGNGAVWTELFTRAESERAVLCKHLAGKSLFTAMLRLYAALHRELRDSVLSVSVGHKSTEEFREQRRRKRNPSDENAKKPKTGVPTPESKEPRLCPTRNFFAPLRTAEMDLECTHVEDTSESPTSEKQQTSSRAGRPPPVILPSAINLIQLQRHISDIVNPSTT